MPSPKEKAGRILNPQEIYLPILLDETPMSLMTNVRTGSIPPIKKVIKK